jgi:ubiquinone/menaquinone biosynthesis C-methylase UbiE
MQLRTGTQNAPGADFALMDAAMLALRDAAFDNVICVEAAFHFDTREVFLRHAYRVLRPGGRLVLTDILLPKWAESGRGLRTERNYVRNLEEYRDLYLRSGFGEVEIVDATYESWTRFYKESLRWQWRAVQQSRMTMRAYAASYLRLHLANLGMRYYLLVCARRG